MHKSDSKDKRISLKPFPADGENHHEAYPSFLIEVADLTRNAVTGINGLPHGLHELVLPKRFLDIIYPPADPVVPFVPPVAPANDAPANAQPRANWERDVINYNKIQEALEVTKRAIVDALDSYSISAISVDNIQGLVQMSAKEIMETLDGFYGTLTAAVCDNLFRQLEFDAPVSTSFRQAQEALDRHRRVHQKFLYSRPLSEMDKVRYLKKSLQQCGQFKTAINGYLNSNPLPQNQTFRGMADAIMQAVNNDTMDPPSLKTIFGYAAQANAINAEQDEEDSEKEAANQAVTRKRKTEDNSKSSELYCWTHGFWNHPSANCRMQAIGHQVSSTARNRP